MDAVVTPFVAPAMNPAICDMPLIPGTDIHTRYSPSVIVFTLAIGSYYLSGMFQQGQAGIKYSWISILFIVMLALAQTAVIFRQKACPPARTSGIIVAWIIGIVSGIVGFWIAWGVNHGSGTPSSVPVVTQTKKEHFGNPLFDVNSAVGLETTAQDESTNPWFAESKKEESGHCKVPDDETYYVDMYKDGRLVTQAIGEKLIS